MPAPQPPASDVDSIVARLRSRLLDLTLRNPLLNFKHAARSRRLVRVVDELPDQLFWRLDEEKEFRFKSLGVEEDEPADEKTLEFRRALDAGKLTDEAYLKGLREAGNEGGERVAARLERELRGRVRAALGLPARSGRESRDAAEVARARGIDPAFDLPAVSAREGHSAHADAFIQTLAFENELVRTLTTMREQVNTSIEESGVNPLFCVFGFLEWYEDDASEQALHAPLLLQPLDIDRAVVSGRFDYRVRATGEGVAVNVALAERLKALDVHLPALGDEDGPEAYWKKVESAVARMKG